MVNISIVLVASMYVVGAPVDSDILRLTCCAESTPGELFEVPADLVSRHIAGLRRMQAYCKETTSGRDAIEKVLPGTESA